MGRGFQSYFYPNMGTVVPQDCFWQVESELSSPTGDSVKVGLYCMQP